MKQLLILSGKGGTGKTTLATAFIKLSKAEAFADCDVDAPNLHLLMNVGEPKNSDYMGLPKAFLDQSLCVQCGKCFEKCKFNSIEFKDGKYLIDYYGCEGCGVCAFVCPVNAIEMRPDVAGVLTLFKEDYVFSTAKLKMGSGTSGKLVTEVKKQMINNVDDPMFSIIDGSPGIGCPVIASLSGVDMVLIVTEPSVSGISDMKRIIETAYKFQTKIAVCVNKYDTNINNTNEIIDFCKDNSIPYVGSIPYDKEAVRTVNQGLSIIDVECPSGIATKKVYSKVNKILFD